ncbi:MAG: endolytic transglycosylase MltG [Ferruginibacter sp.]|nr:endolytic transglycosylase MltG [Ferruginibacter sp.]
MATENKNAGRIILVIIVIAAFAAWRLIGSNTNFDEPSKSFYIKTGSNFKEVMNNLRTQGILKNPGTFEWVALRLGYDKKVRAGKYVIEKGSGIYSIVKKLRSGRQTAVKLVINKLRTKEDLAKKIGAGFECDSTAFINLLNNADSLKKYGLDTNTVMTAIIPNTYSILWNEPAKGIFKKLYGEQEIFWNEERKKKAAGLNLSPAQAYTLASIVEEETNQEADRGKIASVYLNRLETGMKLAADPTVKFAMRDFGLKRIYNKHLQFPSAYNTYLHPGLPPGPICTPSIKTIEAVLNSPSTSYLFFVAKPDLKGFSNFATTYEEHLRYAKEYQRALDSLIAAKETR